MRDLNQEGEDGILIPACLTLTMCELPWGWGVLW